MRTVSQAALVLSSPVLLSLRSATSDEHQRLERRLSLLTPELTLTRYRSVLAAFYGFWAPLEASLASAAVALGSTFPLSPRSPLLRRDLEALGLSVAQVDELPRCEVLPRLQRLEQLAGCLYVLEGARLGGQVVARFLRRSFGLEPAGGGAFFGDAAMQTRQRWYAYLEWLNAVAGSRVGQELVVHCAKETFAALLGWVEQRGVGR